MQNKHKMRLVLSILAIMLTNSFAHAQDTTTNNLSHHIVIEIDGTAKYRSVDWVDDAWQTLSVGLPVNSNWLIRPDGPSKIKILCADGTTTTIQEGTAKPDCIDIPLPPIESMIPPTERGNDPNSVTILSPVDRIAGTTPTVTWSGAQNYERYRVSFLLNGQEFFYEDIQGTTYQISDPELLQRGNSYTIRITPITTINDLIFSLRDTVTVFVLSSEEYSKVYDRRMQVQTATTSEVDSADIVVYTEAWTFYEYSLFSEAATSLSAIVSPTSEQPDGDPVRLKTSPYPYILIGNALKEMGYFSSAQEYYGLSLRLAKEINDLSVIVIILNHLAELQSDALIQLCYSEQARTLASSLSNPAIEVSIDNIGKCD